MKKRLSCIMSFLLALALAVCLVPAQGLTHVRAEAGKDWTGYTPISTKEELNNIRNDLTGKYYLTQDIVFSQEDFAPGGIFYNSGNGWEPIGGETPFTGILDGNGCSIVGLKMNVANLTLTESEKAYFGLFGNMYGGSVSNLGMENSDIRIHVAQSGEKVSVGSIAGVMGSVANCYSNGNITVDVDKGDVNVGGLVGEGGYTGGEGMEGSVTNSHFSGSVTVKASQDADANTGGICGQTNWGYLVDNCYNTGTVSGDSSAAGIVGFCQFKITNSYNAGTVISAGSAAGIVSSLFTGRVQHCYNTGAIDGDIAASGICGGATWGDVDFCYNTGVITGDFRASGICGVAGQSGIRYAYNTGAVSGEHAAGIAGQLNHPTTNLEDCYNTGAIDGDIAGGIVERCGDATVYRCYNIGTVTGREKRGSIAGELVTGMRIPGNAVDCYYLNDGTPGVGYSEEGSRVEIDPCTEAQLMQQETFMNFDFETIWTMEGNSAYPFPELRKVEMVGEYVEKPVTVYRVYNPGNGKHHYTTDASERDFLAENGWIYEGIAWNAPQEGAPIYRVYNPGNDNHLYTMDAAERDRLVEGGWNYEGILCYSAGTDGVPLYRVFNPYVTLNPHHYTDSLEECEFLKSNGWRVEGISWYGLK